MKVKILLLSMFLSLCFNITSLAYVRVPVASGISIYNNGKVVVDYSNSGQGYIMLQYNGSNNKVKLQITKDTTYTYDVYGRGSYEVFPLTEGSGNYNIQIYENVTGNQYAQAGGETISVSLENEYNTFLYPSQYVNFSEGSAAIQTGNSLKGDSVVSTVTNVYNYVVNNTTYDNNKAATVQSGYLPNIDTTLATKQGICFDYAALMAAMLRAQDIPTKLQIGYQGSAYHAWISVYSSEQGWIDNIISFDGTNWTMMDPTYASTGGRGYGNCSAAGGYITKYNY